MMLRQALQRRRFCPTRSIAASGSMSEPTLLTLQAHNPEQEEAEEEIEVSYKGEDLEVGFNVNYLLDALGAIEGRKSSSGSPTSNSSCLIRVPGQRHHATSSCPCGCRGFDGGGSTTSAAHAEAFLEGIVRHAPALGRSPPCSCDSGRRLLGCSTWNRKGIPRSFAATDDSHVHRSVAHTRAAGG